MIEIGHVLVNQVIEYIPFHSMRMRYRLYQAFRDSCKARKSGAVTLHVNLRVCVDAFSSWSSYIGRVAISGIFER